MTLFASQHYSTPPSSERHRDDDPSPLHRRTPRPHRTGPPSRASDLPSTSAMKLGRWLSSRSRRGTPPPGWAGEVSGS
ncbi:hypothetical protein HMPREF9571_01081 [Cutibacterium acnes HL043PA2]|nr:hypothetical protein HMPREF9571_01081 [Cutibacterium acnes HL043PA2]